MSVRDLSKGQVIVYENKVEVRLEKETVWLAQKQMAILFEKGIPTINEHIKNIYKEKELDKNSTIRKFRIVQTEGGRQVERDIEFYNLDVIISIGYRVKSHCGTQFRIWATNVLKQHLVNGYTINEKRLKSARHKYQELQKSLKLLGNVIQIEAVSGETKGLIQVITEYSHALDILDDFDHERLSVPKGTKQSKFKLTYEEARKIIEAMKRKFKHSAFVGQEKDESFKSSIGTIYQTFGGVDLYPTVEDKAAHLLYFVTKNHSFVDGNKRIAAALFICFLQGNGLLVRKDGDKRIDDNTLVALTLMIAASKASEKETMIKVILNLLI
ncbi:virulence RhuM family protein [bacterium]|nr:virulence RhuM family protein [bacterium]